MRVLELAKDLKVETEALLQLLREMGIAVRGVSAQVSEADIARVIARMERGRRAGAKDASEAMLAAVEDASSGTKRRRRRRVAAAEPEPVEAVSALVPAVETEEAPPAEAPQPRARKRRAPAAEAEDPGSQGTGDSSPSSTTGDEFEVEVRPDPRQEARSDLVAEAPTEPDPDAPKPEAVPESALEIPGPESAPLGIDEADWLARRAAVGDAARRFLKPTPAASAAPGGDRTDSGGGGVHARRQEEGIEGQEEGKEAAAGRPGRGRGEHLAGHGRDQRREQEAASEGVGPNSRGARVGRD